MNMQARNLTTRQEQFCIAYIETGSGAEAYRTAYSAGNMKPATIHRRAFDLLENGKIQARLAELRQPAIERAEMTLEGHLAELAILRDQAKERGMLSAAVAAEVNRGKAAGFYRHAESQGAAVINQVNINNKRPEELSDEELMQIARQAGLCVVPSGQFEQEIKSLFQEI